MSLRRDDLPTRAFSTGRVRSLALMEVFCATEREVAADASVPEKARPADLLMVCAWCRKTLIDGIWLHPSRISQHAAAAMDDTVSGVSHGICTDCLTEMQEGPSGETQPATG